MKWPKLFHPKVKQSTVVDKRRQDNNDTPPKVMMGSLAQHHVSTNHLCGIKVSKCCNRALYDAAKR